MYVEFCVYVCECVVDGFFVEEECGGDVFVGMFVGDEFGDVVFVFVELIGVRVVCCVVVFG